MTTVVAEADEGEGEARGQWRGKGGVVNLTFKLQTKKIKKRKKK